MSVIFQKSEINLISSYVSIPLFSTGLQFEFINPIFEFSKGMNDLQLDEAEYALLIAINIFSAGQISFWPKIVTIEECVKPKCVFIVMFRIGLFYLCFLFVKRCLFYLYTFLDRPNVQDHDLVERLQQPYVDALRSYITIKRPNVSAHLFM